MVEAMQPGSVIVDLAAERGGNCELTKFGQTVTHRGVTILGPDNLPSTIPFHASQMYAKNVATLLLHLVKSGKLEIEIEDEITRETMVVRNGEIVHPKVREALERNAAAGREPDGSRRDALAGPRGGKLYFGRRAVRPYSPMARVAAGGSSARQVLLRLDNPSRNISCPANSPPRLTP